MCKLQYNLCPQARTKQMYNKLIGKLSKYKMTATKGKLASRCTGCVTVYMSPVDTWLSAVCLLLIGHKLHGFSFEISNWSCCNLAPDVKFVFLIKVFQRGVPRFATNFLATNFHFDPCILVQCLYHHDDVIKWKKIPRYWPFVRGICRSSVNSPHKGKWRGALMFSLIYAWINGWISNHAAGDLIRHRLHFYATVISSRKHQLLCKFDFDSGNWLVPPGNKPV